MTNLPLTRFLPVAAVAPLKQASFHINDSNLLDEVEFPEEEDPALRDLIMRSEFSTRDPPPQR